MKKHLRTDSEGNEVETFTTTGVLTSIQKEPTSNSNGTLYYRFTADIEMPRGNITCLGQVYEGMVEHLGEKPEVGKSYAFSTTMEALKEKNNKVWSVIGKNIDDISDDILDDLENML